LYDACINNEGRNDGQSGSMIERAQTAKRGLIPITVRLAPEDHEFIDGLVEDLGVSRQDLMQNLIKAGIREALELTKLAPDDPEASSASHFHILNTNKRHHIEDHDRMLNEGIAAAFYAPWKFNIDRIQKNVSARFPTPSFRCREGTRLRPQPNFADAIHDRR
jgi:hypothetical protein